MSRHDRTLASKTDDVTAPKPETPEAAPVKPGRKKTLVLAGLIGVVGVLAWYGQGYWTHGRFMVDTDDAFVTADIALISSRVQGYVSEVPVKENASVKAGDVLVRLDEGDYRIALQVAQSRLETASETLARIEAQTDAARAGIRQAEAMRDVAQAQLRTAKTSAERIEHLAAEKIAAQSQLDTAIETLDTATASLASANAAIASAEAQVAVLKAQYAEAVGAQRELALDVDQARRDLDLTVLRAPADGTIANMTLEVGDLVAPGARLAALVPLQGLYVEANFKETQLEGLSVGAEVEMHFDSLKGQNFTGHVTSISPATGSVFSLLPADNATGNFTKIVQRVPVRIAIPQAALATGRLRAGLSAVVEVDSRTGGATHTAAVAAEIQ
ncbi:MAG: membrane fusion protein (multidrug efflux system) [Sulfitobacter sp.]|jgi:membrane fusion protein, multidrug efflux system